MHYIMNVSNQTQQQYKTIKWTKMSLTEQMQLVEKNNEKKKKKLLKQRAQRQ